MKIFITGGSGYIGSTTIPLLLGAGHEVLALARSDDSAARLKHFGTKVLVIKGGLKDVDILARAASESDGVIHLAFIHDFTDFATSIKVDLAAIKAMGDALKGTGKFFVGTAGLAMYSDANGPITETLPSPKLSPRVPAENLVISFKDHNVRSMVIRLPFTVHGVGKQGFIPTYVENSKKIGVAEYVNEGVNFWPAVNVKDAAELYLMAAENGKAGSFYHGVSETGIEFKKIAETVAKGLGIPTASISSQQAFQDYAWLGAFIAMSAKASSEATQAELGWKPTHDSLFEDITNHYTK